MHLRYRHVVPLVATCLALVIAPALADKPAPISVTPSGPTIIMGSVASGTPACQMGVLGPAGSLWTGLFFPPNDEYYTLLNPFQCSTCPENNVQLTTAHLQIFFQQDCTLNVSVSIVSSQDPNGDLCFVPSGPEICPPLQYQLSSGGVLNQCIDFALPLPANCCVNYWSFLKIELDGGNCPGGEPGVCAPLSCQNCTQYNFYPGGPAFPGRDLCVFGQPFGFTGIVMYADAECCAPTSTVPGSWGMLKTIYR